MDSVTQVLLGSATAALVAPKNYRKRAIFVGAGLGTLPDLDVFIHYSNGLLDYTRHRSFSHSLFVLPVVALVLLPMLYRVFPSMCLKKMYLLIILPLITHPLLDAFTSYGTQLFWPIPLAPTFSASVYIIDPLYSLWLFFGLCLYLYASRFKWANTAGLVISTLYLGVGIYVQQHAKQQLVTAFPNTQSSEWVTGALTASPFCWHGMRVGKDHYTEVGFNVLNPDNMVIEEYDILPMDKATGSLRLLRWFNPQTVARKKGDEIITSDLRMGEFGNYVFEFVVSPSENDGVQKPRFSGNWQPRKMNNAAKALRRINSENVASYPVQKWMQFQRCLTGEI